MTKKATSKRNYKTINDELIAIVEWFDGNDLDLDEALQKFEAGIKLSNELQNYLRGAENTVEVLRHKFGQVANSNL